ncbi:hypothetical protein LGN19_32045 [Burkholderia sp. AU30198]|uniref:hypothetical protein n=1 Tax=Burkholderia sp. AU30198 TaxID=2879627 RepID=UPI001CF54877|nr:hypothetical protein [Burkholderia sp. AU30198]MCA8298432.1 hypothetical protein [Burkholderia sp. AU30198]
MKSGEIFVADTQIQSFSYQDGRLTVLIRADGGMFEVIFHKVLGVKALSPEGQDLSHLAERKEGSYLFALCEAAEELANDFREFSFVSAWTDEPLLTVVAVDVQVSRALT